MIIRACAFTTEGWKLIDRIELGLESFLIERKEGTQDIDDWVREGFQTGAPILFVGAIGIAVRKIAPYISNKLTDSPVIVEDEKGKYVIPLLSNHVGRANDIARRIAEVTLGQVVITTATDVNNMFAVDVFARNNGLQIINKDGIKKVSSKLLSGEKIRIAIHPVIEVNRKEIPDCISIVNYDVCADVIIDVPDKENDYCGNEKLQSTDVLKLVYQPYVIGVGCKKGIEFEKINAFITKTLKENCIDENLIAGMASIDIKSRERGILYFEAKHRIPFTTFSAKQLEEIEGNFSESDFVKQVTGVSNVCERAAMKLAGDEAELIVRKVASEGMTLAVCKRKARINLWEM